MRYLEVNKKMIARIESNSLGDQVVEYFEMFWGKDGCSKMSCLHTNVEYEGSWLSDAEIIEKGQALCVKFKL